MQQLQLSSARVEAEPVGIVIVGPPRTEVVPRVRAYVWGPAPDVVPDVIEEPRAAA
jgi:hypothetical protein